MSARESGLSQAERLRLEEHLVGCQPCAREASLLDRLTKMLGDQPDQIGPAARELAIERALRAARSTSLPAPARPPLWGALATAALVGAAALWLGVLRDGGEGLPQGELASAPAGEIATQPARDRVLVGELLHGGARLEAGAATPADTLLTTAAGAELMLGEARVTLREGSAVRWLPQESTLVLDRGGALCEVARLEQPERFAVRTQHFEAVVLGTRFEVTPQDVVVHEGHVRVVGPDGRVLVERLDAGERFEQQADAGEAETAADQAVDQDQGEAPPTTTTRDPATAERARRQRNARAEALLSNARAHLGAGAVAEARSAIGEALSLHPQRGLRAEALSLRAEAHLVAGERAQAVRAYLLVAQRFATSAAGENALFAAARLEATARGERARALLERYLARYPQGRFVREVRSRLQGLPATP